MRTSYPVVIRLAWAVLLCLIAGAACAGDTQINDDGEAGNPHNPSDYSIVETREDFQINSFDDAVSRRFNAEQSAAIYSMASNSLGIDLNSIDMGAGTGFNEQRRQWTEPRPEPTTPNVNWETCSFQASNGWTVVLHTECTGDTGNYADLSNGGGTGTFLLTLTDPDGNVSWITCCITATDIVFQRFHTEQMVSDNATVIIHGPGSIDEDIVYSWSVELPDSNLPEEIPDEIWDVKWSGPLNASWMTFGGNPQSGSGTSFSTRFIQPGSNTISVEVNREYSYKVWRTVDNPSYVEGVSDPEDAFIQVEKTMTGVIRGSTSRTVTIADITPPNLTFTFTATHGANDISARESPPNKEPPKTIDVRVSGRNFTDDFEEDTAIGPVQAPAYSLVVIDSTLDPSLMGLFVRQRERFRMEARASDNISASDSMTPTWWIDNSSDGSVILPEGQTEYFQFRFSNTDTTDEWAINCAVSDDAGNTTVIKIPLNVITTGFDVNSLRLKTKKVKH